MIFKKCGCYLYISVVSFPLIPHHLPSTCHCLPLCLICRPVSFPWRSCWLSMAIQYQIQRRRPVTWLPVCQTWHWTRYTTWGAQNTPVASFVFHLFIKTDFDWSNRSENFWESVKNIKLNDCTSNEYANSVFLFLLFCLLFFVFLSYYMFGLGSDNWGSLPWGAGRIISRRSHPLSHLKHLGSASPHPR